MLNDLNMKDILILSEKDDQKEIKPLEQHHGDIEELLNIKDILNTVPNAKSKEVQMQEEIRIKNLSALIIGKSRNDKQAPIHEEYMTELNNKLKE